MEDHRLKQWLSDFFGVFRGRLSMASFIGVIARFWLGHDSQGSREKATRM